MKYALLILFVLCGAWWAASYRPAPQPTIAVPPIVATAAHQLEIAPDKLLTALGGLPPDVREAAATLDIPAATIADALSLPFNDRPSGIVHHAGQPLPGRYLVAPMNETTTYLYDETGATIQTWESDYPAGAVAYLLDNGDLVRQGKIANATFDNLGGNGGIIERFDSTGRLMWQYQLPEIQISHHDIAVLPNGHLLLLVYEVLTAEQAIALGRDPETIPPYDQALWDDVIIEVDPETNTQIWAWRTSDYLVQNFAADKPNFDDPDQARDRVDINFVEGDIVPDWLHFNSVDYDAARGLILVSVRQFSELWIIDHKSDKLLWRWRGAPDDRLYFQHDARWRPDGTITLFDNGSDARPQSRILTIQPDLSNHTADILHTYTADGFFSRFGGSVQPLPDDGFLISETTTDRVFAIDTAGTTLWEWQQPAGTWAFRFDWYRGSVNQ